MSTEEKPKFNTITGSDWKLSLRAARTRRTLHRILIKKQIETAHENRTRSIYSVLPHDGPAATRGGTEIPPDAQVAL